MLFNKKVEWVSWFFLLKSTSNTILNFKELAKNFQTKKSHWDSKFCKKSLKKDKFHCDCNTRWTSFSNIPLSCYKFMTMHCSACTKVFPRSSLRVMSLKPFRAVSIQFLPAIFNRVDPFLGIVGQKNAIRILFWPFPADSLAIVLHNLHHHKIIDCALFKNWNCIFLLRDFCRFMRIFLCFRYIKGEQFFWAVEGWRRKGWS